jgi:hypothetical protein
MSTIKNGEVGVLDTMGQVVWEEAEDLRYYEDIHGNDEGIQDRRKYTMERMECDLEDYVETLDRAILFLWNRAHDLDEDVLSLLSIDGKIALLRKLILERSNELPVSGRMDYLARFEDNFETYARVEQIRNKAVRRYLLEPNGTWLRELVDADDWIVTAWSELDESMSCEHEGFVGLFNSRRG